MRVHAAVAAVAIGVVWGVGVGVGEAGTDTPAAGSAAPSVGSAAPPPPAPNPAQAPAPGAVVDLTIDRAIELAASRNERAAIADLNVTVADAAVVKARAALLPLVNVTNANATWLPFNVAPKGSTIDAKFSTTGTLVASQPLFVPSAYPLLDSAKNALVGQREQTVDDKRVLGFDTQHAFLAVLLADAVVKDADKKLHTAKEDVDTTTAQFRAQLASTNDVTRAQIEYSGAVATLEQAKGALEGAYVALEFLVNTGVARSIVTPTALLDAAVVPPPPTDLLVREAIARRPDLHAKRDDAISAHDSAREPPLRFIPTLTAQGTVLASNNGELDNHDIDAQLAVVLTWDIFDGFNRDADRESRVALAQIADLNADALQRSVEEGIKLAVAQLVSAQAALIAAKDAADQSQKSADEENILYQQGLAKAIELIDANDERFEADVAYAQALDTVAEAYVSLRQALGLAANGTELK